MRYFLQRLLQFLIVFFIVTFGVMVLLRLGLDGPGDPARTLLGGAATPEQIEATNEKYHLDSNYFVQYWYWLKGMLTGDFGYSVTNNLPVADLMKGRVMTTLLLGFYAMTHRRARSPSRSASTRRTGVTASSTSRPAASRSCSSPYPASSSPCS